MAHRPEIQVTLQNPVMAGPLMSTLPSLWASILARQVAAGLLKGVAVPGEIDATQRGMPYNVTTEMDLKLWSIAAKAEQYRNLLLETPPEVLAKRYRQRELPEFGLTAFLAEYGHRGAAEIDVGVPRWAENPTPLFAALAGYLRVSDPKTAPDVRFARAAAEAEEDLDLLVGRAVQSRPSDPPWPGICSAGRGPSPASGSCRSSSGCTRSARSATASVGGKRAS